MYKIPNRPRAALVLGAAVLAILLVSAALAWAAAPSISVSPTSGFAGSSATVSGSDFPIGGYADIYWDSPYEVLKSGVLGPSFSVSVTIPPNSGPGTHSITARGYTATGEPAGTATAAFVVVDSTSPAPSPTSHPHPASSSRGSATESSGGSGGAPPYPPDSPSSPPPGTGSGSTSSTESGSSGSGSDVTAGDARTDRSITLVLSGKLVAAGRVSSSDGSCEANATVKIQRRRSGEWRTIASTSTNEGGAYRTRLRDRPGTYRAKAPATNSCEAARSARVTR